MEIRNPLTTLPPPLTPPRRETLALEAEPAPATGDGQKQHAGLTEYISHGELLEAGDNTDYRDLIRAARQQQAAPSARSTAPEGGPSAYATRALSAYQNNSTDETAGELQPRIDTRV